ncbi:MAG: uncharacterized protein QOG53_1430 [Frankiales bacterium]|jgi:hypothetical protein|nr:uncharacterized protein [Frankiales bacterium]
MTTDRDRDDRGRARNARPRDSTGRLLPADADGVAPIDEVTRSPAEALALAEDLINEGRPFAAHEVLEGPWKQAPEEERDFWQGLAQIAVGLTHAQRGNASGAVALLERAGDRLAGYAGTRRHGVDVDGVRRQAREFSEQIEQHGLPIPVHITWR